MPKQRTLAVYANPNAHLDHEGRPAHACPTDPEHTGEERRWVGARLCTERTRLLDFKSKDQAKSVAARCHEHPQDTVFVFEEAPVEVPESYYYLERLRHGDILPADAKTAKRAGIAFSDPKARIARTRAEAALRWFDQHEELPEWGSPAEVLGALASLTDPQKEALGELAAAATATPPADPPATLPEDAPSAPPASPEALAADAPPADPPAPADTAEAEPGRRTKKAASASKE